ncbi:MAG TPA: NADH-quinone oxidoreductase subunit C [Candidatus Hypogeohydataceae bacterium YC38]
MTDSITLKKLKERFTNSVLETHSFRGDDTAVVKRVDVLEICRFLKEDTELSYNFLMDLTAADYLGKEPRFEVVYHLYSLKHNMRVRIKVPLSESDPTIDSVSSLWASANWAERECWDLFGIRFNEHPDLRRILLYEQFQGHPLRKDYPVDKRQPLIGPKN